MWNSVRAKLTLWYVLLFGVLLLGSSLCLYVLIARSFRERLDLSLINTAQTAAKLFQGELSENGGDPRVATGHFFNEFKPPHLYVAVLQTPPAGGPKLLATNFDKGTPPSIPAGLQPVLPAPAILAQARQTHEPLTIEAAWFKPAGGRMAVYAFNAEAQDFIMLVAETRAISAAYLTELRRIFYFSFPVLLLVAGLAGYWFAQTACAPIAAMTAQAELISARNLHERLPIKNAKDELGQLAGVFNQLLNRLEASFDRMRAFTADASHELRTPLAIIRGEAEVALAQERSPGEYQEALTLIQDEAGRVAGLVEDLLALARADAGQHKLHLEELYLNDLVEESCRSVKTLAHKRQVALHYVPVEDIPMRGDSELLRRMVLNLLDNAIKYTPSGGAVQVQLLRNCNHAELQITDTGVGIPAADAAQVFERFYRVDRARTRTEGGSSGLGLSIVKWIAEAHHGSITLASQPGHGSTFRVSLPLEQ
ncbi:MAG: HAMP domain-containing protein [Acidobacteria bacterium]|nr:HAMP domain-containing protein [Acidobacteriota bacterium]MBI3427746.1 HAMP domain-containing protein [Acidobacteriota bacterium]